jgi:hypothetical protein
MNEVSIVAPEQLEYLPAKTLLRLLEKSQTASKNAKLFKQTVTGLPELFRRFEELDIDPAFCLDNEWISLSFAGDGDKLKTVWTVLRRHGFNTPLRPAKGDTAFNAFWKREGHADIFMMFSSTLCKRVQIGTEMKEVPVYQTQCGELPEIEAETSAVAVVNNDIPF